MLRKKTLTIFAAALVLSGSMAMAADLEKSALYYGSGPRTATVTPLGDGDCISQSADNTTIAAGTVACQGGGIITDNTFARVYDLDGGFGITGGYTVGGVDYGVETSTGNVPLEIAIYEIPNGSNITATGLPAPTCSANVVQADGDLLLESVEVAGCPAIDGSASDIVVAVNTPNCQETGTCIAYFHGSNGLGESGPSYIAADDCGIVNPVPFADIGFPGINLLLDLCGAGDTPPVPAVGPLGALITILALGAGSGYVIRRRREV